MSTPHGSIIEPTANGASPELTQRNLTQRVRQQEILAQLGVSALDGASLDQLLDDTAQMVAEGLKAEFSKVLEYIPDENRLLIRAGVGWKPGVVGVASLGADLASPSGFALKTGKPVISNHLENEERFRTPEVLMEHGIRRAMNVILQGNGKPFGVLEVDSRSEDEFVEQDLAFLQGAANLLGMAIERDRRERDLKQALERHRMLVKEMNHRVKNSLAIVSSMLHLQAREGGSPEITQKFEEAARRVSAVGRAHERLYRNNEIGGMDLGIYLEEVCKDMDASVEHCIVHVDAEHGIEVSIDNAISTALVVVELITNSAKYAYPGGVGGEIWVTLVREGSSLVRLTVRDQGIGLPSDFDPSKAKGLGMRIIGAFTTQLNAELKFHPRNPGTEAVLLIPKE